MSQRHYSSYLSKLDAPSNASSSYQSDSPMGRVRKSYGDEKKSRASSRPSYQSNYDNDDDREPRSYNTERKTAPTNLTYNTGEKFASDATVSTNMLYDAIDDALDANARGGGRESRMKHTPPPPPPPPPPPRVTNNIRSSTPSSYNDYSQYGDSIRTRYNEVRSTSRPHDRHQTPINDYASITKPISQYEGRTIPHHDDNYRSTSRQHADMSGSDVHSRREYSPYHPELREYEWHNPSYHREDVSLISNRRGVGDSYSNSLNQRERESDPYRPGDSSSNNYSYERDFSGYSDGNRYSQSSASYNNRSRDEYSERRRETYTSRSRDEYIDRRRDTYTPRSRDDYSDRIRDTYTPRSRDDYSDRRRDAYTPGSRDDFGHNIRSTSTPASRDNSYDRTRQTNSNPRPLYRDNYDNRSHDNRTRLDAASVGGATRKSRDTLMTFDVVHDEGNIKFRSRNQSPMQSSQSHSATTFYKFSPESMIQQQPREKEDQRQIVINVHTNPSVPHVEALTQETPKTASVNLNYSDILATNSSHHSAHVQHHQTPRGRYPPRNPASKVVDNDDASDISSVTGMPKTVHHARSVMSHKSTATHWKNSDVIYLPKNQSIAEASVTAAAAASVIVSDVENRFSFDTAVKSVSNILKANDEGKVDKAETVGQSVSHDDLYGLNDETVVPLSFKKLRQNVREVMREKETQTGENPLRKEMDASDFYARCALLAATAIMKADPRDKAIIAQTAAETIMNYHQNVRSKDWLQTADDNLKDMSLEVSNVIKDLPVSNTNAMASLASVAVLSEGGKTLAMERIRQRVNKSSSMDVNEMDDNDQGIGEVEDIISPIRNKGSLMDNLADSDDSDSESVEINKSPSHNQQNSTTRTFSKAPSRDNAYPPIQKVPSLSLSTKAEVMKQASSQTRRLPESKEQIQSAVRKLLASSSEENMDTNESFNIRTKMSSDLDMKQVEIAKRIQRIQMRAAGKSDEEIQAVIGQLGAFSSDNLSIRGSSKLKDNIDFKSSRARNNKDLDLDDEDLMAEFPSAKEIIGGIGNMLSVGKTYLEGLKFDKLKLPSLPQCSMDIDDLEDDNYNDMLHEQNEASLQHQQQKSVHHSGDHTMPPNGSETPSAFNVNGVTNGQDKIHPQTVDTTIPSPHSGLTDDEHEQDWTSFRSPQERNSFDLKKPPSYESPTNINDYHSNNHDDGMMIHRQSSRISLSKIRSTDTGAFSAALRKGDFSDIPIQKLSLVPPGPSGNHNEGTTTDLFFGASGGHTHADGASEMYNTARFERNEYDDSRHDPIPSNMMNFDRGESERMGLVDGERKMDYIPPRSKVKRKMFSRNHK